MIDEPTEELASLYVLDLLAGGERNVFEAQLAADLELEQWVRELRETTGALALTAQATPSPRLKTNLLNQIQAAPDKVASVEPINAPTPFRISTWIPWAVAAGFALVAGWLGMEALLSREQTALMQTEAQFAGIALRDAQNHLVAERIVLNRQIAADGEQLADAQRRLTDTARQLASLTRESKVQDDLSQLKIATLSSMLGNSPQALAVAVWNPAQQEGVFTVEKLPAAAAGQDYELWVIDPQQPKPVSGGVFTVGTDGRARMLFKPETPVASIAKFSVSREKKGGAPRLSGPQGEVIMISQ